MERETGQGYCTVWVKRVEIVPVIHYLLFMSDFKLALLDIKPLPSRLKDSMDKKDVPKWKYTKNR